MPYSIIGLIVSVVWCYQLVENNNDGLTSSSPTHISNSDTVRYTQSTIGIGGNTWTDQHALVIHPPERSELTRLRIYYTSLGGTASDSSRLFVKSQRSWSCAPLGGAHPFMTDTLTLGLSKNIAVDTGWNEYSFDPPLPIDTDTLFIWPDLVQFVQPRVVFSTDFTTVVNSVNGTLCASPANGIRPQQYASELTFLQSPPCQDSITISALSTHYYKANNIILSATIDSASNVEFVIGNCMAFDTATSINSTAELEVNIETCVDE